MLIQLDSAPQRAFGGYLTSILVGIQILAWVSQFIGHGVYEKRAPALMTNLMFMWLGPFFVFFEILNLAFGYKQAEKEEYDKTVFADIAFYRKKQGYPQMLTKDQKI